ncbi:MAG: heparinase II/III family protein [Pseudomonadota bacterium]|nr:heparinase II/III family protein [Pseudomonadota bacterium]
MKIITLDDLNEKIFQSKSFKPSRKYKNEADYLDILSQSKNYFLKSGSENEGFLESAIFSSNGFGDFFFKNFDIDWKLGEIEKNVNLSWQLHNFNFLRQSLKKVVLHQDSRKLKILIDILRGWFEEATREEKPMFAWNDHTAAFRLDFLINFIYVFDEQFHVDCKDKEFIFRLTELHFRFLLDENFYSKGTNHGLDQSFSLIKCLVYFPDCIFFIEQHNIVIGRINFELEKSFAADGAHVENSPEYHFTILSTYIKIKNYLCKYYPKYNDSSESYDIFINNALTFAACCILPNGLIAPIGDSEFKAPRIDFSHFSGYKNFEHLTYSLSKGHSGKDLGLYKAFLDSGYVFLFSSKTIIPDFKNRIHMIFKCGFLSYYHRQDDDNSLYVYGFGEEWLIDGGLYRHDHQNIQREYFRSALAHNVFMPWPQKTNRMYAPQPIPKILSLEADEITTKVVAQTSMYEGYIWTRTLRYNHGLYFTIDDYIRSTSNELGQADHYDLLFQIPSNKSVLINGKQNIKIISQISQLGINMDIISSSFFSIECLTKKDDPSINRSKIYNQLEDCTLIRIRLPWNKEATVETRLNYFNLN